MYLITRINTYQKNKNKKKNMNNVEVDTNADNQKNNHILLIPKITSNDKNNKLSNRKRKRKNQKTI